jgi:hypothetical protein
MMTRLGQAGKTYVEDLAREHGVSASEVIRQAIIVARQHEPELLNRLKEAQ